MTFTDGHEYVVHIPNCPCTRCKEREKMVMFFEIHRCDVCGGISEMGFYPERDDYSELEIEACQYVIWSHDNWNNPRPENLHCVCDDTPEEYQARIRVLSRQHYSHDRIKRLENMWDRKAKHG